MESKVLKRVLNVDEDVIRELLECFEGDYLYHTDLVDE